MEKEIALNYIRKYKELYLSNILKIQTSKVSIEIDFIRYYLLVGHTIMISWEMLTGRFFNFSAQNQNFTGSSNGPDLP